MTDELQSIALIIEIEPSALALLQQQADQQGLALDQLAARYVGRAAAQAETHAGHIRAANAFNGLVERNQPKPRRSEPEPVRQHVRALAREAGKERSPMDGGNDLTQRRTGSEPASMPPHTRKGH